jgi:mono/diheme cytochrome c family protein
MTVTFSALQRFAFCVVLTLLVAACEGLAGEPQIIATIPPSTPSRGYPPSPPDIANGAQIFAARCASCHGIAGAGDGPVATGGQLVVDGVTMNPGNFTVAEAAQANTPLDWYNTITNGRIERLMPPWREALTEQERWDVAMYTYTLHYSPDALAQAQRIVSQSSNIQSVLTAAANDPSYLANLNDPGLLTFVNQSLRELDRYTPEQQLAVVQYGRTLSFQNAQQVAMIAPTPAIQATQAPAAAGTAVAVLPSVLGVVEGQITNGTAFSQVPSPLTVTLHIVSRVGDANGQAQFNEETREVAAVNGVYRFENVMIDAQVAYFVSVSYRDRRFASPPAAGDPAAARLNLPVTIYELTDDVSVINITSTVLRIAPSQTELSGLDVVQVIQFENTSDRVFTSVQPAGNGFVSLVIPLPPGSRVLGFGGDESRYVVIDAQSTVVDTLPVLPNENHLVTVAYFVPYDNGAIIDQEFNYAFTGLARVLIGIPNMQLTSENLTRLEELQRVGQRDFDGYSGTLALAPNDSLKFELRGALDGSGAGLIPTNQVLPILAIGLGVAVTIMGATLFWVRRKPTAPNNTRLIDALVSQIAELDEAHNGGRINHDVYQRQRAQLKVRLSDLMEQKKP